MLNSVYTGVSFSWYDSKNKIYLVSVGVGMKGCKLSLGMAACYRGVQVRRLASSAWFSPAVGANGT